MTPNRVTEKSYPNSQTLKEGIEMTSRMRSVAFKALLVGLASLILVFAGPVSTVLADGSHHNSPGQPGHNGGIQFSTPFIIGITGLLINKVTDCATGVAIAPEKLTAEFVFKDGAKAPFNLQDLVKIILKAAGYQNREITSFMTLQFNFGFLKLILIIPLEGDICLPPLVGGPSQPPSVTPPAPDCTCKIYDARIELDSLEPLDAEYGRTSNGNPMLQRLGTKVKANLKITAEGTGKIQIDWRGGLKNRGFWAYLREIAAVASSPADFPRNDEGYFDAIGTRFIDCPGAKQALTIPLEFTVYEYDSSRPGDLDTVGRLLQELQRLVRQRRGWENYNLGYLDGVWFTQTLIIEATARSLCDGSTVNTQLPPYRYRKKFEAAVYQQGNQLVLGGISPRKPGIEPMR
jgi:hypothetical protein